MTKNAPQRERQKRRSPSSYKRKEKQPYQYSAEHRAWRHAVKDNRSAQQHHVEWVQKFVDIRYVDRVHQKATFTILYEAHRKAVEQRKRAA